MGEFPHPPEGAGEEEYMYTNDSSTDGDSSDENYSLSDVIELISSSC